MAKKKIKPKKRISLGIAILAFLINLLILPGLGSIIGAKVKQGIIQLILYVVGILFMIPVLIPIVGLVSIPLALIGILLVLISWIWALITSIQILAKRK